MIPDCNGGQTTASLITHTRNLRIQIEQIFVQMKLTVIKDKEQKNIEVLTFLVLLTAKIKSPS